MSDSFFFMPKTKNAPLWVHSRMFILGKDTSLIDKYISSSDIKFISPGNGITKNDIQSIMGY